MLRTTYIHMVTDNDKNGNPRRLYFATTTDSEATGAVVGFTEAIDEGYEGVQALENVHPNASYVAMIEIVPSEYHRLLKSFPVKTTR